MRSRNVLWFLLLGCLLLSFISVAVSTWSFKFDDSFISFRFAKHLAMGYGLRWNISEPPTEGYTNFLLVIALVPFIKMGFDPLTVTRVLSWLAIFGTFLLIFNFAKRLNKNTDLLHWLAASLILIVPETKEICLTGLETTIYTFFLLFTFITGESSLKNPEDKNKLYLFSFLAFLTFLIRPEGILLCPILGLFYLIEARKRKLSLTFLLNSYLLLFTCSLVYFSWKYWYFGDFLPNPFYVKAASATWFNASGFNSVKNYVLQRSHYTLIIMSLAGLLTRFETPQEPRQYNSRLIFLCLLFTGSYFLFFLRVDTLMDAYGRFIYPVTPILVLSSLPFLNRALSLLPNSVARHGLFAVLVFGCFSFVIGGRGSLDLKTPVQNVLALKSTVSEMNIMAKENRIAEKLARFQHIQDTRIAFGDAGVIPYYTGSIWLDTVGLTDHFIAREKRIDRLVDYVFNWNADLMILGSNRDGSWPPFGHGTLGNFYLWAHDKRFDNYEYAGTTVTEVFGLHYYVKRDSKLREPLEQFLKTEVIDGAYSSPPFDLGTQKGAIRGLETWHAG